MARIASNGGTGVLALSALAADFANRQKRLKELSKAQVDIGKRRAVLDREQAELERQVTALTGVGTAPARTPKAAKVKGKVGRPAGKTAKTPKAARANGEPKLTTLSALLQVMPDGDPITKDAAVAAVNKLGLNRNKVVVGQTLGQSKFFLNPSRGMWKLSASGIAARDKASAPATPKAAKPAPMPKTVAATPAVQSPATVIPPAAPQPEAQPAA